MRVRRWVAIAGSGALALGGLVAIAAPAGAGAPSGPYHVFNDPTTGENLLVPDGVCGMFVEASGAQGGAGANFDDGGSFGSGGLGGFARGWVPLTPGDNLEVRVGGAGGDGSTSTGSANGGLNGGGNGAPSGSTLFGGGGGGGYSGVFAEGDDTRPLIVAGGGGGAGIASPPQSEETLVPGDGGDGSGTDGNAGTDGTDDNLDPVVRGGGGGGGTATTGGSGGTSADSFTGADGSDGSYLQGGAGGGDTGSQWGYGGGGGGGRYGGGGGADSFTASGGGGGGSGLVPAIDGSSTTGINPGDGDVVITWTPCAVDLTVHKTLAKDDPGVAFPIDVTCTATFDNELDGGPAADNADLVLTPDVPSASTTVNLKGGQEATFVVSATVYPTSLDCTVTEGAVTLPTGTTCQSAKYQPNANPAFWDQGLFLSDAETVNVVNTCTIEAVAPDVVVIQPTFTG